MSLRSILLTAVVITVVWVWLANRRYKDVALRRAVRYCDELSLKLLDQTVVLRRIRLRRNQGGKWCLERRYSFDFSASGEQRYEGEVTMMGPHIERIQLQPHRID